MELVEGEDDAAALEPLEDWSLLATVLLDELVLGAELWLALPLASFFATALVLPVWLSEELELVEGEAAAVLLLLEDWSLLATEPVEDAVLEVEPLALPVEAKPLVEPVWLSELLLLDDGDDALFEALAD